MDPVWSKVAALAPNWVISSIKIAPPTHFLVQNLENPQIWSKMLKIFKNHVFFQTCPEIILAHLLLHLGQHHPSLIGYIFFVKSNFHIFICLLVASLQFSRNLLIKNWTLKKIQRQFDNFENSYVTYFDVNACQNLKNLPSTTKFIREKYPCGSFPL